MMENSTAKPRGRQIECEVLIPGDKKTGGFANAFRIIREGKGEWFLDFFVFDEKDENQQATLVSRIRVQEGLLPAIRDRLNKTLTEIPAVRMCPGPTDIQ